MITRYVQISAKEAYENHLDKTILTADITDGRTWQIRKLIELTGLEVEAVTSNGRYIFFRKEEAISED